MGRYRILIGWNIYFNITNFPIYLRKNRNFPFHKPKIPKLGRDKKDQMPIVLVSTQELETPTFFNHPDSFELEKQETHYYKQPFFCYITANH
jgi:hypothetical protein